MNKFRDWLYFMVWCPVRDWCLRVIHCHHNARVLADMEYRLGCVLNQVTNGMSKPYYTLAAMSAEIEDYQCLVYLRGYNEGRKDPKVLGMRGVWYVMHDMEC